MKIDSSFYIRYMDDVIIMAKNKWSFRRFIRKVNRILENLGLCKAEEKTFIGKIEKGFDFLGFHFSREGMRVSRKSVHKFAENVVLRLNSCMASDTGQITPGPEADISGSSGIYDARRSPEENMKGDLLIPETVSVYVRRWFIWVKSIYGNKGTVVAAACAFST